MNPLGDIGRVLIILGVVLVAAGILAMFWDKLPFGRLPGDIIIKKDGFSFYFPWVTCLVISVAVSLLYWIFRR